MTPPSPSPDQVVVVGAGISGVACARVLQEAGVSVRLLDRGRRIGGRMASKRFEGRPADIGASYLTVGDDDFAAVVEEWRSRGLAHPWTDTFTALAPGRAPEPKRGPVRWGTAGGIRTLVEALAAGLEVGTAQEVVQVGRSPAGRPTVDGVPARAVLLAMPDPQAARLLDPAAYGAVVAALDVPFEPVLALTATWGDRCWRDLPHGAFVNDDPVLSWIADDGRRRGDDAPVLVAHSTPGLAAGHLEDPAAAAPLLVERLRALVGARAAPVQAHVHRWSLARPERGREQATYLWGEDLLGVCGDAWSSRPRVEGAWLSGRALGRAVVETLS
ncbi:protoporphyrinogen oxidase [Nocardioides dokdonensis FR1436]|uniref:Protoporphyrinogen oxidase n=1 Tax=Nocardioides dokdonensis FR1436 TaxID=1300347 RepID=A0A1A9GPS1_9ACTN|nr:FAD-dependent oxidoreductase [Nocardioides dokdonensis]ANH39660.1 protoporphyrinogen oxidase [Nocardioides dokdonensis FR1436]